MVQPWYVKTMKFVEKLRFLARNEAQNRKISLLTNAALSEFCLSKATFLEIVPRPDILAMHAAHEYKLGFLVLLIYGFDFVCDGHARTRSVEYMHGSFMFCGHFVFLFLICICRVDLCLSDESFV